MTSTEHVSLITSDKTLDTNDFVYLIDASSNDVKITLPDISIFDGVTFRIVRIDSNIIYKVTVEGYNTSQLINNFITVSLLPNFQSLLIVSFNQKWYGAISRSRSMLIPYSSGSSIVLTTSILGAITNASLISQGTSTTQTNILGTSFNTSESNALCFVSPTSGYITNLNVSIYNNFTLNLLSSLNLIFEVFISSSSGSFVSTGFKATLTLSSNQSGGSILTGSTTGYVPVVVGDRILLRCISTTTLISLSLSFSMSGGIIII